MVMNFIDLFVAGLSSYSDKPAIIFANKIITYSELHQRSNAFAKHLVNLDVNPEEIIPIILERSLDTIITMLGILKAGCAFLPISPITPCSRISFILEDTSARIIICNGDIKNIDQAKIMVVRPSDIPTDNQLINRKIEPNHLAYVMYTSGSTGNPKGVMIEHGSMMNLFSSLMDELMITEQDFFIALTDYTFDISLIELLMPLLSGATILLTEQGVVADGVKIKHYLENYDVTFMQATPLSWEILLKQGWQNNGRMKILVGGEKFQSSLAERLDYKKGNIRNMYGPTETSMWSMMCSLYHPLITESVPLGKPLKNTLIQILDEDLNPVKRGSQGELYIGGDGLARGYLGNAELTREKFIYHPLTQIRLYKTGDLAIAYEEQTICYIGRTDDQLKFGGIRIEAGEIESVIEQVPFVKKAVIKIHETEGFYKSLAAYIEIDEGKIFSEGVQHPDMSDFLKNIYDETYRDAENYEHGSINNCGWQSSLTGKLFDMEELGESWKFIRKTIGESDLASVLEVGCGTGSILLDYIDKADDCTVVELSSNAIEYVQNRLDENQQKKTFFINASVTTFSEYQKYTCVIVNSVIQYLPSIEAVISTITQLVKATKPNGSIIIGDVRSLEFMDIYYLEKLRVNTGDFQENLNSFFYKSRDTEIVLSPMFFYALQSTLKDISHIDISVKHGTCKNELNYFRYDVILHINKPILYQEPVIIPWLDTVKEHLVQETISLNPDKPVIIRNVPNIFLQDMLTVINNDTIHYVAPSAPDLKQHYSENVILQIDSLIRFEPASHEKFVRYEANAINELEVLWYPESKDHMTRHQQINDVGNYQDYCREPFNPWLQKYCFDQIKLQVSQHVVSWVNPSVYVWMEKWPLSINGKLDKKKLQLPVSIKEVRQGEEGIVEQLQLMWRNITGDNALVDKEFWVHGISSLCMYFFLATINETFLLKINYHEFREYDTLVKLANYVEQLVSEGVNQQNCQEIIN